MSAEKRQEVWKKAEKLIASGKYAGVIEQLLEVDEAGEFATTWRLAAEVRWKEAEKNPTKKNYRKAAENFRKALKLEPKNKTANSGYNNLLNEMNEKRISEHSIPPLVNDGTPTLAGVVVGLVGLIALLGILSASQVETSLGTGEAVMTIQWTTEDGLMRTDEITLDLYRQDAPIHVENFIELAEDGSYDDVIFHRIIDNFMIQGGDFTNGDGTGGHAASWQGYCNGQQSASSSECAPTAYTIPDEANNGRTHTPGALSMAKTNAANTGGSQFFIVPSDSTPSHLDGVHTVFGMVTNGLDIITEISEVSTEAGDRPVRDVTLVSVEVTDDGIKNSRFNFF